MLKQELLALLNTEAIALGLRPVSERTLEDWISEDYLEGPDPKGQKRGVNPNWEYSAKAAERALQVVRLRAGGTKRAAATRVRLFLMGHDLSPLQIRKDLASEFRRLLGRQLFRRPWTYDPQSAPRSSAQERQKQLRRIGSADSRLVAAGLVPPDDTIVQLGSEFCLGVKKVHDFSPLIAEVISAMPIPEGQKQIIVADAESYFRIFGIFGDPDEIENSGLSDLKKANDQDHLKGRTFYQFVLGLFEIFDKVMDLSGWAEPPLKTAAQITIASIRETDEWSVVLLAIGTVAAYRRRLCETGTADA